MGLPLYAVENFFSRTTFPSHLLDASSAESGRAQRYVGTGRRSDSLNFWTPTTLNADAWVSVDCQQTRAADFLAIDRGHNLNGSTVRLQTSGNGSSWRTVVEAVVPSTVRPFSPLAELPGVLTSEGAFVLRFEQTAAVYWRLFIPAMGAGLRPKIVGLYVGKSFQPETPLDRPFGFGQIDLRYNEVVSTEAWAGAGRVATRRTVQFGQKLASREEYEIARYHIESLMLRRKPTWFFPDDEQAEKGFLGYAPPGVAGFQQTAGRDWFHMQGTFTLHEHEPKVGGGI